MTYPLGMQLADVIGVALFASGIASSCFSFYLDRSMWTKGTDPTRLGICFGIAGMVLCLAGPITALAMHANAGAYRSTTTTVLTPADQACDPEETR